MTQARLPDLIRRYLKLLPIEAPYPDSASVGKPLVNRLQFALYDPAFRWNFSRSFVLLGRDLPLEIGDVGIRKAFQFQRGNWASSNIEEAVMLAHPTHDRLRKVVQALLICDDLGFEEIARLAGVSSAVIREYETLFFSAVDRREDRIFLSRLCFADTRLSNASEGHLSDHNEPQILLRAAFERGSADVKYLLGMTGEAGDLDPRHRMLGLESNLLAEAKFMVRYGQCKPLEVLRAVTRLMTAQAKSSGPSTDSVWIKFSQRIADELLKIAKGEASY